MGHTGSIVKKHNETTQTKLKPTNLPTNPPPQKKKKKIKNKKKLKKRRKKNESTLDVNA